VRFFVPAVRQWDGLLGPGPAGPAGSAPLRLRTAPLPGTCPGSRPALLRPRPGPPRARAGDSTTKLACRAPEAPDPTRTTRAPGPAGPGRGLYHQAGVPGPGGSGPDPYYPRPGPRGPGPGTLPPSWRAGPLRLRIRPELPAPRAPWARAGNSTTLSAGRAPVAPVPTRTTRRRHGPTWSRLDASRDSAVVRRAHAPAGPVRRLPARVT
jgi:hypothetical protein